MHRWDIHLLRAVAVLAVVGYHAGVPHMHGGGLGVDVFFVLSGYLITSTLLALPVTRTALTGFFKRRVARTIPAAVVTAAGIAVLITLVQPEMWDAARWHLLAALTSSENWLVAGIDLSHSQFPALTPYTHYWSLATEEQFYLVWPWFVAAAAWLAVRWRFEWPDRPRRLVLTAALVAAMAASIHLYLTWSVDLHGAAYFSPVSRVWELGAGALVALWSPLRSAPTGERRGFSPAAIAAVAVFLAGVATIAWCITQGGFVDSRDSPLWGMAVVGVTALLLATGRHLPLMSTGWRRALAPVLGVATVSYGLYLWHLPVIWALDTTDVLAQRTPAWWAVVMLGAGGAATLSWYLVEKPGMAWARRRPVREAAPVPEPARVPAPVGATAAR